MHVIDRRTFLADMGRGALGLAIVSLAACSPAAVATGTPRRSSPASAFPSPSREPSPEPPSSSGAGGTPGGMPPARDETTWHRVNLGFVSAYIIVRGGEAAIVDTGVGGSADAIEDSLTAVGLDWAAVGHLVLTHRHDDHVGSAAEILERAGDASGYAGEEDLTGITVPRPLTAVGDGDSVFGLQVVTAPGHTPGSICVYDAAASFLVAGDALRTAAGSPSLPGEQFTQDMAEAARSVAKLGALTFETLLVGHGEPIETGASAAVAELAARQ